MTDATRPTVLLIDDEPSMGVAMEELLGDLYEVHAAPDAESALERLRDRRYDCILLDLGLPRMYGLTFLDRFRARDPWTPLIVLTAAREIATAVRAMRLGAQDFITKPWEVEALRQAVSREVERARLRLRIEALEADKGTPITFESILTTAPRMYGLLNEARRVSTSEANVLITGESGTGKEILARAMHNNSTRRGSFIAVNCAAIPENLAESEFLGHVKGAFTGAQRNRRGYLELAHEGTLFLDEVTSLSPALQAKILRVLDDGMVRRVGDEGTIRVNVRVFSATNQDIQAEVKAGRFREDLFYRLKVIRVHLPPLRERAGDVALLLDHFLGWFNARNRKSLLGYEEEARRRLCAYAWPGNIRELANEVHRLVILEEGERIGLDHLPVDVLETGESGAHRGDGVFSLDGARARAEVEAIRKALEHVEYDKGRAAALLGISLHHLMRMLKAHKIDVLAKAKPSTAAPPQMPFRHAAVDKSVPA